MPKEKVIVGPDRVTYRGKIFAIHERDVTFPDGHKTVYEYCERPASVSTLAFNDKNELLLIKERRVGYKGLTWFLPGGRMENGDSPKNAALRELREETGYGARTFKRISKKSPSSTLIWDIHLFAARDLYVSPLEKDKGEYSEPYFIPFKKAVKMALDGTIDNEFMCYNIIRFNEMLKSGEFTWN